MEVQQFNQLVELHSSKLYRLAYRTLGQSHLAEDVVQETFKSVWSGNTDFQLRDVDDTGMGWLVKILRRRMTDLFRLKPFPKLSENLEISVEDVYIDQEFSSNIQKALDSLPQDMKETLLLVAVMEWTHKEVATHLNVPLGTVLSRVNRARQKMRELLAEDYGKENIRPRNNNGSRPKCRALPIATALATVSVR